MRRIHIIVLFIILAFVILAAVKLDIPSLFHSAPEDPDQVEPGPEPGPESDIRTITLTAVGGLYPHLDVYKRQGQGVHASGKGDRPGENGEIR